jgi:ABC-2 type transport system permease protein
MEAAMASLLRYEINSRRGAILGWGLGVGAYIGIYMLFYPTLPAEMTEVDLMQSELYRSFGMLDMRTFEGYFATTIAAFLAVLVAIYAVVDGSGTLAGQEESGVLEQFATLPLPRWQLVVAKAIGLTVASLLILSIGSLGAMLGFAAIAGQLDTDLAVLDMAIPVLNAWPITLMFAMLSLFLSALLPQRKHAAALATLAVIVSFFGYNLLTMDPDTERFGQLLPFHYYDRRPAIFTEGVAAGDVALLLGAALAFAVLAVLAFNARNLTTGSWAWSRGRAPGK